MATNYDSNWWFGPNSLYAHIMDDTVYGREGAQTDRTISDYFTGLFEGTGVTATVGVAPDTDVMNQIKQYLPLVMILYFLNKK